MSFKSSDTLFYIRKQKPFINAHYFKLAGSQSFSEISISVELDPDSQFQTYLHPRSQFQMTWIQLWADRAIILNNSYFSHLNPESSFPLYTISLLWSCKSKLASLDAGHLKLGDGIHVDRLPGASAVSHQKIKSYSDKCPKKNTQRSVLSSQRLKMTGIQHIWNWDQVLFEIRIQGSNPIQNWGLRLKALPAPFDFWGSAPCYFLHFCSVLLFLGIGLVWSPCSHHIFCPCSLPFSPQSPCSHIPHSEPWNI